MTTAIWFFVVGIVINHAYCHIVGVKESIENNIWAPYNPTIRSPSEARVHGVQKCGKSVCDEHSSDPGSPPDGKTADTFFSFLEIAYHRGSRDKSAPIGKEAGSPLLLTPYIEAKKLKEAREAARVNASHFLPDTNSYAGYLTVNKKYNANLWFWYFPVSGKKVEDTPWIIWLQGGPGASSLYGLFTEIGPFFVTEDYHIEEMKYSWNKNFSLLFIDNPVGTGFSFTDDERGYTTNQTTVGENLYNALQQFLTIFPELRQAPLTIAGESYAGKYIPAIGVQILWHRHKEEPINFQGLAIGNGFIDPISLQRYSYFVREIGLTDDATADTMAQLEAQVVKSITDGDTMMALDYYNHMMSVLYRNSNIPNIYNYLQGNIDLQGSFESYIERESVRRALHVGNTEFTFTGEVYTKLLPDIMRSTKAWLEELLDNCRVMLYNGHLDVIVAYHPSVNTYNSLRISGKQDFKHAQRKAWYHDGQLAGYYRVAGNLTEVMVRGAGHMVPSDKPAEALALISAFIRGISLEHDTGRLVH